MTQSNNSDPKNWEHEPSSPADYNSRDAGEHGGDDDGREETVITTIPQDLREKIAKKDRVYLLVIAGHFTGQMFRIEQDQVLLGRGADCELSLADNDISREHAQINRLPDGTVMLCDLRSTNGTFVNGQKIQSCRLQDGDRIQLGRSTILKFSLHDELEELFQRRLYESAVLDGLTQVYNRKFFDERLNTEFSFAIRHNTPLSILLMDIDHFKSINDNYGHPAGDEVLRRVSQTIWNAIREEDIVARYGGEEFVVLARGIMPTQAAILGERIRSMIERLEVPVEGHVPLKLTISVGVATVSSEQFQSAAELVQTADERLYRAKRGGRNQVVAESS
ncbi:MAG TPA: GGDEF domain-containing protein [Myxococcales bacterium]|nr:GGDEF domain-containing protein [Deltaproteobacteria bacterium]MBU51396.1 GGDEF domain-containing protein [Deltaproteobacteria bacterium]HAA53964.1 GGDEF domain-containing protein [Myxococcales bacterium]|tara:strand:+ start:4011 stop:5015 length:1005 start_codon:yes stop_codon:yes gene_type:complete